MQNILIITGILMILPFTISYAQIEPDPNQPIGPTTNIDDLNRGHSIITQLMTDHADGNFERFENQVINLAFVDPDNGTLVVGFDPIMHVLDIKPNTGDLLTGIPTDIVYSIHGLLSEDQDPLQKYNSMYEHRCVNSLSLFCEKLANELNINQYQDRSVPINTTIFSDNFQNGLKKWNKTDDRNFKAKISDESEHYLPEWSPNNKVLESGKCDPCTVFMKKSIDLTKYNNITMSFDYFIDEELNDDHYLQLDFYNYTQLNTFKRWNGTLNNNTWIPMEIDLTDYKTYDFNLKFTAYSGKNKEISIDNIVIKGIINTDIDGDGVINKLDKCPRSPGFAKLKGCPDYESPGLYMNFYLPGEYLHIRDDKFFYPVIAVDNLDGFVNKTCRPPSGSVQNGFFVLLGKQIIFNCYAIDSTGNTNERILSIIVTEKQHIDLYGGDRHGLNAFYDKRNIIKTFDGTITIGVETNNGTKGVVVAGHSVGYNAFKSSFPIDYHMDHFMLDKNKLRAQIGFGPAVESSSFSIDAAFIPLQTKVDINPYQVKMKNGTIFTVTQSSMAETPRLAKINVYGHLNNDQGRLLFKNVTKVDGNNIYNNMGIFTSAVIVGDSGGPIIYHNNNTNNLIGSVHGATCIIQNITSLGNQTSINEIDPDLCPSVDKNDKNKDYWYYKVFTPWEHIKEDLNIK